MATLGGDVQQSTQLFELSISPFCGRGDRARSARDQIRRRSTGYTTLKLVSQNELFVTRAGGQLTLYSAIVA